jgi:cobalt-zinc-cadmium efflux system membrane fusion protein
LFKIVDLTKLAVYAHVYEDDLPALQALPRPLRWTVKLKGDPRAKPLSGTIERISDILDTNQHTALVVGLVDNPGGHLKAGQFITAIVEIPPAPDELVIPTSALDEDGEESIVFVQADAKLPQYSLRRVSVSRRYHDLVYLHESPRDPLGLKVGDRVVVSGVGELRAALKSLSPSAN